MTNIRIQHNSRKLVRWIKQRFKSSSLILMYHHISELPNDPHLLAVTPKHFAEQLDVIRKLYSPISLGELVESLQAGVMPSQGVVITFDDGYADNLYHAKPILESYDVPATVFVTAGMVGSRCEFWWDELDRLFLQPGVLPTRLQVDLDGTLQEWELGEAATYSEDDYERDQGWNIERKHDPSSRHQLFRWLYSRLHTMPERERRKVMDDLLTWSGAEPAARPTHQALTADEVPLLLQGGLMEVGAHTMTHPNLSILSEEEQCEEIQQSKKFLEVVTQRPVTSFAYPYGSFTPSTPLMLDQLGITCACSSHPDVIWQDADYYQLPRVVVRDWNQEVFTHWLKWWIGD